jgi:hypothetical protein
VSLSTANRSKEHVSPEWLLAYLDVREEAITPTRFSVKSGKPVVVDTRRHRMDSLLAGDVCTPCNTGWMSDLETETKPLLTSLITSDRVVVELRPEERATLARWTAKTAYSL